MSKEFGQKFKDAREKTEKTLEDFSKITKIREKYLQQIENDEFDNEIPDVYMRGFIKSYAKYLRMDVNAIMDECPIKGITAMDSNERRKDMIQKIAKQEMVLDSSSAPNIQSPEHSSYSFNISQESINTYIRIGSLVAGGIVCLLLIILLITKIFLSSSSTSYSDVVTNSQAQTIDNIKRSNTSLSISITATDQTRIIMRTKTQKEKIFSGTLSAGETKIFTFTEPMQLFYDKGESLLIKQANGVLLYPKPGRGGLEL